MYCMLDIQNPVYYRKFRHIHIQFRHCGIFRTMRNSCIFRNLPYSKSWHIQNPRYIQNSVSTYSSIFRTLCNASALRILPYSEFGHIQETRHNQNLVYLGTLRYIQAYTIIIVIITLNFFFFTSVLHNFQQNLKRHMFFDYNDVNFNAPLSLLK